MPDRERLLIASDLHANSQALSACLEALQGRYSAILCLGDLVGYGASPHPVLEWVQQNAQTTIRGNHDRAALSPNPPTEFSALAATAANWTHSQLSDEEHTWLGTLPAGPLVWNNQMILAHGSPRDENEYVSDTQTADEVLRDLRSTYGVPALCFFGHTHLQGGFELLKHGARPLAFEDRAESLSCRWGEGLLKRLRLSPEQTLLINPGSVGQPRDGDWRAACAIYDIANAELEFYRIPYDLASAQRHIRLAGLPEPLAARLEFGR